MNIFYRRFEIDEFFFIKTFSTKKIRCLVTFGIVSEEIKHILQ